MEMKNNMPASYRIPLGEATGEIEEKRSRFIATLRPVEGEEEALAFLEEVKKKYWDARHNCYAYVIGKKGELVRFSDDGEPGGTAGKPMLEVLLSEKICNVAVVVTRYFGGTLLGTGGLVRAYTQAVKEVLQNTKIGIMHYGQVIAIETDYNSIGKILYLLPQKGIDPGKPVYTDTVRMQVVVPVDRVEEITKELTEVTAGKAQISLEELDYFLGES